VNQAGVWVLLSFYRLAERTHDAVSVRFDAMFTVGIQDRNEWRVRKVFPLFFAIARNSRSKIGFALKQTCREVQRSLSVRVGWDGIPA
jgi:hypothetical protein